MYKGYLTAMIGAKAPNGKYKDSDKDLISYDAAISSGLDIYGRLNNLYSFIDFDTQERAGAFLRLNKGLKLKCNILKTTDGIHVYFKNNDPKFKTNVIGKSTPIGLVADWKHGRTNGIDRLKRDGIQREFIQVVSESEIEEFPFYLKYVNFNVPQFLGMKDHDGRNGEMFNYMIPLKRAKFTYEQYKIITNIINDHIMADKLAPGDYEIVTRKSAWDSVIIKKNEILESPQGYFKVATDENGKEQKIQISSFTIQPESLIKTGKESELHGYLNYEGATIPISIDCKVLCDIKLFKSTFKSITGIGWFEGGNNELALIEKLIESKDIKNIVGVPCSGLHKLNGEWVYVTSDGAIDKSGNVLDDVSVLRNNKGIDNPNIIHAEEITPDDLKLLSELIFSFNSPGITACIIGYTAALFIKERLFQTYQRKFPHLKIIGASGSGKSVTVENIIMPILNLIADQDQQSAKQATPFVNLKNSSSTNTAPYIINEYKPNKLPEHIKRDIDCTVNQTYDRLIGSRGRQDQTVKEYHQTSSIILVGEAYDSDTSATERFIGLMFSKADSLKHQEAFHKLTELSDVLHKLGKSLLLYGLNVSDEDISSFMESNLSAVKKYPIQSTRPIENITMVFTGIDMIFNLYKEAGLSLEELSGISKDSIKEAAFNTFYEDTLNSQEISKSAVVEIIEAFDELAQSGNIFQSINYSILRNANHLALNIKSIYGIYEADRKRRGLDTILSQTEFTKQLRKEAFFLDYKPVRLVDDTKTKLVKCYILDIDILKTNTTEIENLIDGFEKPEKYYDDYLAPVKKD